MINARFGDLTIGEHAPVRIVGIVNVGPASFYHRSVVNGRAALRRRARSMVAAGADMLDIGARSTAPYLSDSISLDEEAALLADAVATIRSAVSVPLSADTFHPVPLQAALEAGATVTNDVHGLADPRVAELVRRYHTGLILMAHPLDRTYAPNALETVTERLQAGLAAALLAGIDAERIVLDPGIGFFRQDDPPWYEWDGTILRGLNTLHSLGRPLLIGVSRKSFIGQIANEPDPANRLPGSLAATTIAIKNGASMIRTHDVKQTAQAARIAQWLR